jgi:hypothetical protein
MELNKMSVVNKGKNIKQVDEKKQKQQEIKRKEKEVQRQKAYWNAMITREEARDMVIKSQEPLMEQMRTMFIQVKTLTEFVLQNGIATEEQLNEIGVPIYNEMYGIPSKQEVENPEEVTKDADKPVQGSNN